VNILGIETSCDETAAAVVKDGRVVLSSVVSTQIPFHKPYSGVVPELASRAHVVGIKFEAQARRTKFQVVFKEILNRIKFNLQDAGFEEKRVGLLIRRLYQVWGFYALARYPSLRKRNPRQKNKPSATKEFDYPRDE
jgi:hypothetical protein